MKYFNNFNEMYSNNTNNFQSIFNYNANNNYTYWDGTESFEKSCVNNLVDFFGDLVEYYDETNGGVYNGDYEDIFDEWRILGESDVVCDYVMEHELYATHSAQDLINDLGDEDERGEDYNDIDSTLYHRACELLNDYWDSHRDYIFADAEQIISKKYPKQYWDSTVKYWDK